MTMIENFKKAEKIVSGDTSSNPMGNFEDPRLKTTNRISMLDSWYFVSVEMSNTRQAIIQFQMRTLSDTEDAVECLKPYLTGIWTLILQCSPVIDYDLFENLEKEYEKLNTAIDSYHLLCVKRQKIKLKLEKTPKELKQKLYRLFRIALVCEQHAGMYLRLKENDDDFDEKIKKYTKALTGD